MECIKHRPFPFQHTNPIFMGPAVIGLGLDSVALATFPPSTYIRGNVSGGKNSV